MGHEQIRKALTNLSIADFATLIANIEGATKQVPEHGTVAERSVRLIEWAESHGGPGLDEVERIFSDVLTSTTPTRVFLVPHRRNPYFTGREEELETLHRTLNDSNRLGQAISGLGGIGKTQTAVAYAYKYRDEYQAVLWVQSESTEQLTRGFGGIADKLQLPHDPAKADDAVRAAKRWLEMNRDWLLILDNADEPELVEPFLPVDIRGHVLLTSRAHVFAKLGIPSPLALDTLPLDDAIAFLYRRTNREQADSTDINTAKELVQELGRLPLALEQAAAYIAAMHVSFSKYLDLYRKQPLTTLEKGAPVAGRYPESVATTWAVNIEQLDEAQRDVLRLSAFLAPENIPMDLISTGKSCLGEAIETALGEAGLVQEILGPLHRFSLVGLCDRGESYNVHRLVQVVTMEALDADETSIWVTRTFEAMNAAAPDSAEDVETWPLFERLVPHVLQARHLIKDDCLGSEEAAELIHQTAIYLRHRGQYSLALPLSEQAVGMLRDLLGENHPAFAKSCTNLGALYASMGRYSDAEPLHQQALQILEDVHGEHHLHVVQSSNNLALLYRYTERYEEAEKLYKQALEAKQALLGEDDPSVATGCNNLAELYKSTGRHPEAEPLYERAREIRRVVFGKEHPKYGESCCNLGSLYLAVGRDDEAELLLREALEIQRLTLGEEHTDFAACLWWVAILEERSGHLSKAMDMSEQVAQTYAAALGAEHPTSIKAIDHYRRLSREVGSDIHL